MPSTWLITGASSGLGASLALVALEAGHRVIATSRNIDSAATGQPKIAELGGKWLQLDVADPSAKPVIERAVREHDVDVLVNNAGYALRGVLEDFSESHIYDQINTNFIGVLRAIQGALPTFRAKRRGTIVNVSSTSGLTGFPGFSLYAASKFALEGASEGLKGELAPFGIRVLLVEPGAFRTNFQNAGVTVPISAAYQGTAADQIVARVMSGGGKEPGDPVRGAQAIYDVVEKRGRGEEKALESLLRLPLGKDAVARGKAKVDDLVENHAKMEGFAVGASFPE